MQLKPVAQRSEPSYPARAVKLRGAYTWLRRAVAAAAVAGALGLGGCYGATPFGREPGGVDPVEPGTITAAPPGPFVPVEERMMGDYAPLFFVCGDAIPETFIDAISVPGWFDGSLCGDQTAFAALDVPGGGPDLRITLGSGAEVAVVSILAPDGTELAELGPEATSVELPQIAGRWILAASPVDPEVGSEWFSGSVDLVE